MCGVPLCPVDHLSVWYASCSVVVSFCFCILQKGGLRPLWFQGHRALQSLAVLLALAGFILALVSFNVPWSNMSASSTPHKLYNPHRVLGVVVMALVALQVGVAGG